MQANANISLSGEKYGSTDRKFNKLKAWKQWTGFIKAGI